MLAAGFGDSAEAGVAAEEKVAGVEGFLLEGGAVGGDEEPVADLVFQQLDAAEGREVAAEGGAVAEHEDEEVAGIDGEAGEHAADLGVEKLERVEDEGIGDLARRFTWSGGLRGFGVFYGARHGPVRLTMLAGSWRRNWFEGGVFDLWRMNSTFVLHRPVETARLS